MAETPAVNPLKELAGSEAADRLKAEAQDYLVAQATRLLTGVGRGLGRTTARLNDIAEGNSPGFARPALDGARTPAAGKGPVRTAVEVGAGRLKENLVSGVKGWLGPGGKDGKGRSRAGGGQKPTVILESIDVGVDVRTAYDQWTQYQEFSTFARGVKNAGRADDVTSDWQMKIFWSTRSYKAHTTEQVPDQRICWTSEGAKGTTKGVVTFHALGERLTRVLLIIEYYPEGLFERTGNIWRAQGRRARLDLKHYARFISLRGEASDGWRGEIRDGEVVRSHEDAVAEEEDSERADFAEEEPEEYADEYDEEYAAEGEPDEYDDASEDAYLDEDAPADEPDDDEDGYAGEYEEADEDEYDDEYDDGEEPAYDGEEPAYEDEEPAYDAEDDDADEVADDERGHRAGAGARSR
ncbi:SRPBCC family protein [Streptomyces sp. VRA16 Mangrove soil]|uniref:SRPBCC family protein n=1 Tax=Streptomyces sp. VRA16 Mangrove soil TaxID=2817434 RepID=UPI001A9FB91A|nr:SRPBCC family protein [Streptomyces sp. VRA16 Mangrove soil]MBO1330258.1 SRPBCC family protein [Streptomyces sp. VRA16 Mangrove soil]